MVDNNAVFKNTKTKNIKIDNNLVYESISAKYNECIKNSDIDPKLRPALEIIYHNEKYRLNPDGTTQITALDENDKFYNTDLAFYNSETHTVKVLADNFNEESGIYVGETISHELHHAKEAILRNSIPQEERNKIVREILLENIKNGESYKIVKSYENNEYSVMVSPVMSKRMSETYSKFIEDYILTDNQKTVSQLKKYYELKYNSKKADKIQIKELEIELKPVLDKLNKIIRDNPYYEPQEFSPFNIIANKKEKKRELLEYAIAISNRYKIYTEPEINTAIPKTDDYNRETVKESIASNIDSVDGNVALSISRDEIANMSAIQKLFASKSMSSNKDFLQYYYSKEELEARITGYEKKIEILKAQKEKASFIEKTKLRRLIYRNLAKIQIEKLNYENYHSKLQLRNHPHDFKLKLQASAINSRLFVLYQCNLLTMLSGHSLESIKQKLALGVTV